MPSLFAQSELADLIDKVEKGQRLDYHDGMRMMKSQEILTLGYMANLIREQKHGNRTYYVVNRPIDYTDVCASFPGSERRSTATLVYGDQESKEKRIEGLIQIRTLQDQAQEFFVFSPLPFYKGNPNLEGSMGLPLTTGYDDLKMLAISRILLDNIDHIKGFWMFLGLKLAQVSLAFGVDELDGTVEETMSAEGLSLSKQALINLVTKAGRDAVERKVHANDNLKNH
ncbi:hypothetical protein Desor_1299 [Desulfosporosinus orientis DSM 765]|uniref:CofH/MqnC-like C-terminal domain-containing protein n=1 Tax=Desulfosporosinus orientis (strain ATCC 19365 / DSM 765 / NCIMB 8382 / VKM B-1628 / Singapore I) TaxID=768706 RepID=G7WES0_DESOD|nr:FO synthase [Desulfosporosinus orientis]AET66961.1 hypothetical protein Desor_1299 [Desulfosporosinus orientis DSM 765]